MSAGSPNGTKKPSADLAFQLFLSQKQALAGLLKQELK
jgi:hypothetical protein